MFFYRDYTTGLIFSQYLPAPGLYKPLKSFYSKGKTVSHCADGRGRSGRSFRRKGERDMATNKTAFDEFIAQEIRDSRGTRFPVKASILERLLTKQARCTDLHPNPDDEFCDPEIGPCYRIISEYQQQYVNTLRTQEQYYEGEPIIVERTHPDGYRIVNGHHRWAAALRIGAEKIPVRVVNLAHRDDVKRILENSTHTKRAAFDLDEVIFREEGAAPLERALSFPWKNLYKERIRLGAPALFHELAQNGYDIWVYSVRYVSSDYVQNLFAKYHVKVDGVMTAIGKRAKAGEDGPSLEKMISEKYASTLHVDNDSVLRIVRKTKDFREFPLSGEAADWSHEVMDVLAQIAEAEKQEAGA